MQNDNQPAQGTTSSSNSPIQSSSTARSQRVIQPSPGLVEELQAQRQQEVANQPPQSVQQPTQSAQAQPIYGSGGLVDPAKIYPNSTPNMAPNANQGEVKPVSGQRVAVRVPSVQVYAFVIMAYSAYSLITLLSLLHTAQGLASGSRLATTSSFSLSSPLHLLVFGTAAINMAVGIYLLVAKNIKTVAALLTALLIIGGLGLLNSIVATAQSIAHITVSAVVSLFISGGMLMYLWSIKSQVDLANID